MGLRSEITDVDRALLTLKTQRNRLGKEQRRLQGLVERETAAARALVAARQRDRALLALRRRTMHLQQLSRSLAARPVMHLHRRLCWGLTISVPQLCAVAHRPPCAAEAPPHACLPPPLMVAAGALHALCPLTVCACLHRRCSRRRGCCHADPWMMDV